MREIKFRGKSKNVNEWCYGTYIFTDDNRNNPFRTGPFKESHRIVFWCSGDWNMGGWVDEEVIPETIGQYTGLKDKNGKEIYEGDIIFSNKCDGRAILHKVEYNEENAMFVTKPIQGLDFDFCQIHQSWIDKYGKVVIGNIYDNPELIKREEK